MISMRSMRTALLAACWLLLGSATQNVSAQTLTPGPGVVIKPLLRTSFSGDERLEAVVVSAEFAPGAGTSRHSHPGDEYATVLEGTLELRSEGQTPQRIVAGEAYHNARGVVHETRNVGTVPVKVISTFIVDKGKPLLQPAP